MSILNGKCERCGAGVQGWNHLCPACIRNEKNQQAAEQNRISNLADQEARQGAARQRERSRSAKEAEAAQDRVLEKVINLMNEKRQEAKEAWYSRECPECAEIVKRKAKICKECGFEFEDWALNRSDIEHWEERGAKVGVDPWNKDEIIEAEAKAEEERIAAKYWASPEGQAEKRRKQEEEEAEKRRKQEEKEAEKRRKQEEKEAEKARLEFIKEQRKAAQSSTNLALFFFIMIAMLIGIMIWLGEMNAL